MLYLVTHNFLEQMKADIRRIHAKVQIDYTDPFLDQSITVTASEQANISYPAQTADAVTDPLGKIAALDGAWTLDSTWCLAPSPEEVKTTQMGWWSAQLSDEFCCFSQPFPTLTVQFSPRPITKLQVIGDSARGEFPPDFDVLLYDENDTLLYGEYVSGNFDVVWNKTLEEAVTQVAKMKLVISTWSHPGRHAKILEFFTAIQETYTGDDIVLVNLLEEREVSQGSLPVGNISSNEIDIRLNNANRKFDAGNKQSPLYQLLKPNRRIKAWLGLKEEGDGMNIKQVVDFNQGTLNNLTVLDNKLQLVSVGNPTFTRNSTAYLSDGTLVNTNIPRFEQGKFGKAVMVEEGTTNLISPPKRAVFGTAFNNPTIEWTADKNFKISGIDGISGTLAFMVHPTTLSSIDITGFTINLVNPCNSARWVIQLIDANWQPITSWGAPPSYWYYNEYYKGWFNTGMEGKTSYTFATLPIGVRGIGFGIRSSILEGGVYCSVQKLQIEAKPYPTSFVDGTRAAETLSIPTAGVLNPQEGTIEFRYYPLETTKYQILLSANGNSPNGFYITLVNGKISFSVGDGSTNRIITTPNSATLKTWYYIVAVWKLTGIELYINGNKVGSLNFIPCPIFNSNMTIGYPSNEYGANMLIDDIRISNRARTDAEILAAYQSNAPLPVDEWTTYKLNLDDNFNFGQGGYYTSPEYDLSAVGTAATSAITWQEEADGIQRSVYAKLDNQNDWTQLQNGGKLPVNVGDVLTGRKLQIKTKLLKGA